MNDMNYNGLGIHVKVEDLERSRQFYEGILGFTPVFGYGDDEFRKSLPAEIDSVLDDGLPGAPERYRGVTYEPTPQSPLEIADGHIAVPDRKVFLTPVDGPKISAMLRAQSLIPLVRDKGVRPDFPVRHYYWGTIEIAIKDPDQFVVVVIAPYSDAEKAGIEQFVPVETITPSSEASDL